MRLKVYILIALTWTVFVAWKYYQVHPYFEDAMRAYFPQIVSILLFILILTGISLLGRSLTSNRKDYKFTLSHLIGIYLIILFGIYNIVNYHLDLSVFKSGYAEGVLVKEGSTFLVFPDQTKIQNLAKIVLKEGELVRDTSQFIQGFPLKAQELFYQNSFWQMNFEFAKKLILPLFTVFLISLVSFCIGSFIFCRYFNHAAQKITNFEHLLLSIGLGFIGITFFLFILGFFYRLDFIYVSLLFTILLTLLIKEVQNFLRIIFRTNIQVKIFSFNWLLFLLLGVFISFNVIDILRPIPVSWDEIIEYINLPNLITQSKGLLSRPAYAFSLLQSLGFVFFESSSSTMFIALLGGILTLGALYFLLNKFASQPISLALTVLYYSLPFIYWQSGIDIKVDPALFYITLLSLISFYYWHQFSYKEHKLVEWRSPFLILTALFLGYGLSIKFTSLLLIILFFCAIGYFVFGYRGFLAFFLGSLGLLDLFGVVFLGNLPLIFEKNLYFMSIFLIAVSCLLLIYSLVFQETKKIKNQIISFLMIGLIMAVPFFPWLINNFRFSPEFTFSNLFYGKYELKIPYQNLGIDPELCSFIGGNEEIERYLGGKTILAAFWRLPWDITMNNYIKKQYVDIGFIFLGLIPIVMVYFLQKKRKVWLIIFVITYFLFWLITSKGIIWYGLPGFAGLLIALAMGIQETRSQMMKYLLGALFGFWFLIVLPLRYHWVNHEQLIAYLNSYRDSNDFTEAIFPGTYKAREILAAQTNQTEQKIIRVGTYLKYWIPENNLRVIDDDSMYGLNCLYIEKNYKKTVERLQKMGVSYIILDKFADNVDTTPMGQTKTRFAYVKQFAAHLKLVFETGRFWLYKIE